MVRLQDAGNAGPRSCVSSGIAFDGDQSAAGALASMTATQRRAVGNAITENTQAQATKTR